MHLILVVLATVLAIASALSPRVPLWVAVLVLCLAAVA
jgi:hypothetical protein